MDSHMYCSWLAKVGYELRKPQPSIYKAETCHGFHVLVRLQVCECLNVWTHVYIWLQAAVVKLHLFLIQ